MRLLIMPCISSLFLGFLVNCKNNAGGSSTETIPPDVAESSSTNCYLAVLTRDSIWMKLTINGLQVDGELNYLFYEKDKSRGNITGSLQGDTLFARYTFMAEGTESDREVAFLKKGGNWVEGYGEMDMETGTRFKNKQAVDFNSKTILKPISCK